MGKMMGFMNIFMVFMIGSVVYSMQSGIGLYIVVTTLFSVIQYTYQYRTLLKVKFNEWRSKGQNVVIEK
jgi:membrane protein insertase Oxa1/YidC/SpoIIIJ